MRASFLYLASMTVLIGCTPSTRPLEEVLDVPAFRRLASARSHEEAAARLAEWRVSGPLPLDGWGHPYRLSVEPLPEGRYSIVIESYGADGVPGPCRCPQYGGDLFWRDGYFVWDEP
ncbi:MAG: hypothetical protein AAGA81_21910 [Acidobacteriota bacterium]